MTEELITDWSCLCIDEEEPSARVPLGDALVKCLATHARVDVGLMAQMADATVGEVINHYEGAIFQDPLSRDWKLAGDYLSGNIPAKLEAAEEAARTDPSFLPNVKALKQAMPARVGLEGIHASIGANFVSPALVRRFICHLLYLDLPVHKVKVIHDPTSGTWSIKNWSCVKNQFENTYTWGTNRLCMIEIVTNLLNGTPMPSSTTINGAKQNFTREETALILEKAAAIRKEWHAWIWDSSARIQTLEEGYNQRYTGFAPPAIDGAWVNPPSCTISLRPP